MRQFLNIRKSWYLPLYALLAFAIISCQEQDDIVPDVETIEEQQFADGETYYKYRGQLYDTVTWARDFQEVSEKSYMVMVENAIHVFDGEEEAIAFSDQVNATPKTEGTGTGSFSVRLYEHKHFGGAWIQYNVHMTIERNDIWGTLSSNEFKQILPTAWRMRISSFKIFNINHATVYKYRMVGTKRVAYGPVPLSLYFTCYIGNNCDGGNTTLKIYNAPGVRVDTYMEDNDLNNDRIASTLWIHTWNDKIQSMKFVFR